MPSKQSAKTQAPMCLPTATAVAGISQAAGRRGLVWKLKQRPGSKSFLWLMKGLMSSRAMYRPRVT